MMNLAESSFCNGNRQREEMCYLTVNTEQCATANKAKNPFKNPYHLTFFKQSLAREYFQRKTSVNKSREVSSRTPHSKRLVNSKLASSRTKGIIQAKTPVVSSLNASKGRGYNPQPLRKNQTGKRCLNIQVTQPLAQTSTRNEKAAKNVVKKENTITGISIKLISQQKGVDNAQANNNTILTANYLSKADRLKMLKKDNAVLQVNNSRQEKGNVILASSSRSKDTTTALTKSAFLNGQGDDPKANEHIISLALNKAKNGHRIEAEHASFAPIVKKSSSKNRYRELINLYLKSEDDE